MIFATAQAQAASNIAITKAATKYLSMQPPQWCASKMQYMVCIRVKKIMLATIKSVLKFNIEIIKKYQH